MDRVPAPSAAETLRFLLLEDSSLDAELVAEHLRGTGLTYTLDQVIAQDEFVHAIDCASYDLILADYVLPSFDGMSALRLARERCPDTPFVFVSGTLGEEIAVEALKRGATDYVLKQRLERLPGTVLRALAESRERAERRRVQQALRDLVEEKTTLLHELDHRVKNNLQLLLSLVGYEIRRADNPEVRGALGLVRERLQALGIVHRLLYPDDGIDAFDAGGFARELCEDLLANSVRTDIVLEAHTEPVPVPAAMAAPIALLLNEMVSGAISHAFQGRSGILKLLVGPAGATCRIEIRDDRFTPAEKQATRAHTTGMIQKALARQLDAAIMWPEDPEILVRITVPAPQRAKSA
ncbi:MAG TPA: histidine kinase dimerization/phosphoacceptor domain -containing protein [Microvirga sp.]|jgi:two-component sensor histidine kinase|nr:histidine kinase dimerization/phosphoacceptor domain -containing protein [Microvirga sp.]